MLAIDTSGVPVQVIVSSAEFIGHPFLAGAGPETVLSSQQTVFPAQPAAVCQQVIASPVPAQIPQPSVTSHKVYCQRKCNIVKFHFLIC